MSLHPTNNKAKYSYSMGVTNKDIEERFGHKEIGLALNAGIGASNICGGLLSRFLDKGALDGSKVVWTARATTAPNVIGSYLFATVALIILTGDAIDEETYSRKLVDMAEEAFERMASRGYGYIVIETDEFEYSTGSGNHWTSAGEMPIRMYWSGSRKGTLLK